jgi:hypothetical protein
LKSVSRFVDRRISMRKGVLERLARSAWIHPWRPFGRPCTRTSSQSSPPVRADSFTSSWVSPPHWVVVGTVSISGEESDGPSRSSAGETMRASHADEELGPCGSLASARAAVVGPASPRSTAAASRRRAARSSDR